MIRAILIGAIFLTLTMVGAGQNSVVNNSLIKARYLVSEKQYADALITMENQQYTGSDDMKALLVKGLALSGVQKYEESNRYLSQVTGVGLSDASYCMAKNCLAMNDFSGAIQSLTKHLADKYHYSEKRIRMDADFNKLENSREWVHLWQTDWYPDVEKQVSECNYLIAGGQNDEAVILINQLLIRYPDQANVWFLQAKLNALQKNDRQLILSLDKAWQLASKNQPLQEEIMKFSLELQMYEKAGIMAYQLIRDDPSNPDYLITRALVRILDGKEAMALKEIETIEQEGIAPAELYYQAGKKISTTKPQQAEMYLSRAIDTGIMDARFYYSRGMVRSAADKIEMALGDLAMSLDINPNQPQLYVDRAQIRLNIGDTEGACHDWKKALEMGNAKAADLLYKYCRLP